MTEKNYIGKPVPKEARLIESYGSGWLYAIGLIRLFTNSEKVVTNQVKVTK